MPNSTKELIQNGQLRQKRLRQGGELAARLGARIVGMGGLVSSFSRGGTFFVDNFKHISFTTGHAYTISNIINIMEQCASEINLDIRRSRVAVVGAGGSIGSGVAELLVKKHPKKILLIESSTFIGMEKLESLSDKLGKETPSSCIEISTSLKTIKNADIVICATNSIYSIIRSDFLRPGAIVIDDSFPKNISRGILKKERCDLS